MSEGHRERAEGRLGQVVSGKWRLDQLLGVGGFAAVYAATHVAIGRRVAIKLLHPAVALSRANTARLVLEARAANAVGEGAVAVLDTGTAEGGEAFFVMDLLDGETVEARRLRSGGRLDAADVLAIADHVLDVLATAHERNIVHRDVKPENLFMTTKGEVKVLDFGIARCRELSTSSHETTTGAWLGTPPFMAPEHAKGEWDLVDAQSDVWSVGATMFTLLSGEHVHGRGSPQAQWVAAMQKKARPLASVAGGVGSKVAAVVDRALAFEKSERWPGARAMQEAVLAAYAEVSAVPSAGAERVNAKDGTVLLYVPGRVFTIGAENITGDEKPVHQVRLSPFWIAKYPVTNRQYGAFLREQPKRAKPSYWDHADFNAPEQPVVGVRWEEASAYASWAGLALPTEAQAEAAARGTDGRRYPWGNDPPDERRANFGQKMRTTTQVGAYPAGAGPYGTLDQAGNVWEWCVDAWDSKAYAKRVATGQSLVDPVNSGDTAVRAVHGGSWLDGPERLAVACRSGVRAGLRLLSLGFRCAWSSSPPSRVGR